jgi:hypothetical protein
LRWKDLIAQAVDGLLARANKMKRFFGLIAEILFWPFAIAFVLALAPMALAAWLAKNEAIFD